MKVPFRLSPFAVAALLAAEGLAMGGLAACTHAPRLPNDPRLKRAGEPRIDHLSRLTRTGQSTQVRFSSDGARLVVTHQGPWDGESAMNANVSSGCPRVYSMKPDGTDARLIAPSAFLRPAMEARPSAAMDGFFLAEGDRIGFSSAHEGSLAPGEECAPTARPAYRLYATRGDGTDLLPLEAGAPGGFNGEADACGDRIVFASDRGNDGDGKPDLYAGRIDRLGTLADVRRIVNAPGLDGGPSFSSDCQRIVWHAERGRAGREIWIADADGNHARQLTRIGAVSSWPVFAPGGKQVVFSSEASRPPGASSASSGTSGLWIIGDDGTRLERITAQGSSRPPGPWDARPAFSPDGKTLAFVSKRGAEDAQGPGRTGIVLADWVDPTKETPPAPFGVEDENAGDRFMATQAKLAGSRESGAGSFLVERFQALGLRPFTELEGIAGFRQKVEVLAPGADGSKRIVAEHNVVGAWGDGCKRYPAVVIGSGMEDASGGAVLLEVASRVSRAMGSKPHVARSCFVFAAFTGREAGLAGSTRLVRALKDKGIRARAMMSLSQLGQLENNRLVVSASETAKAWRGLLDAASAGTGLAFDTGMGAAGYSLGDAASFYAEGIPVLGLTGGTSGRPNATGAVHAAEAIAELALRVAAEKRALGYVAGIGAVAKAPPSSASSASLGASGLTGRAYLGAIPDYGAAVPGGGVRFAGVRSRSPAEKAGVHSGDVLQAIEKPAGSVQPISSLEDFMALLGQLKPGEDVFLHIQRLGETMRMSLRVGRRE